MNSKFKKVFYTLSSFIITLLPLIITSCASKVNDPYRNLINYPYFYNPKENNDDAYQSYYSEVLFAD